MPYEGPGIYRHYKGGLYEAIGIGLKEDTVVKPGQEFEGVPEGIEVVCVIYQPLTPGSLLEGRWQEGTDPRRIHKVRFWLRELGDFDMDIEIPDSGHQVVPRFKLEKCVVCGQNTLRHVGGGIIVCSTCGNNQR